MTCNSVRSAVLLCRMFCVKPHTGLMLSGSTFGGALAHQRQRSSCRTNRYSTSTSGRGHVEMFGIHRLWMRYGPGLGSALFRNRAFPTARRATRQPICSRISLTLRRFMNVQWPWATPSICEAQLPSTSSSKLAYLEFAATEQAHPTHGARLIAKAKTGRRRGGTIELGILIRRLVCYSSNVLNAGITTNVENCINRQW